MKRVKLNARRVGAILMALCLLITCGHCSDLGNSLIKVARAEGEQLDDPNENPADQGGDNSEDVTNPGNSNVKEYTLYNFVKIGSKYGRLRKTTISVKQGDEVEHDATYYLKTVKPTRVGNQDRYFVPTEDYSTEPYDFTGETFVYNGKKYALKSEFDPTKSAYQDFAGYYEVTEVQNGVDEVPVVAIADKIGGTSLTPFEVYAKDNHKVEFNDADADTFHRDYEIKFTDYTMDQPLYNYAVIDKKYYRLGTVTTINAPRIDSIGDGKKLAKGTYECDADRRRDRLHLSR